MGFLPTPISQTTLDNLPWRESLAAADWSDEVMLTYSLKAASEASRDGNAPLAQVLELLSCVLSMRLHPGVCPPFRSLYRDKDGRTYTFDDLSADDVDCLTKLLPGITPASAQAKVADVARVAGRELGIKNWQLGRAAAEAYLTATLAMSTEPPDMRQVEWLHRGIELSWQYSRQEPVNEALWSCATVLAQRSVESRWLGTAFALAELVLQRRHDLATPFAQMLEGLGNAVEAGDGHTDPYGSSRCFSLAARLWFAAKEPGNGRRCQTAAAMVFCDRSGLARAPNMVRADWLAQGIHLLQAARADADMIAELKKRLANIRRSIPDDMHGPGLGIDITDLREHVRKSINAKDPFGALLQLAFDISSGPLHDQVHADVLKSHNTFFFSRLFGSVHYNQAGEPVDRRAALDAGDPEQVYAAMVHHVCETWVGILGEGIALEAAEAYNNRYQPSLTFLLEVAHASIAIPDGHERSIARGLLAGFNNDWHEAGAFLIPQVEPAIRFILKKHEVDTLSDKDGIVEEKGLGELLTLPESPSMLGKNLILILRALMTDRAGCKLRHAYSHGLLADARLVTPPTMALWWVMLRIVLYPFRLAQVEQQDKVQDESPDTEGWQ